ncbi:MAG: antibiotic biosynthesis monooxygenase [Acidimicrobiia bacterium]
MAHDDDPGYWAVARHADVVHVSRNPDLFCSGQGVMLEDVPQFVLDAAQSFLPMDSPRHTTLRRLVSSAFTPRQVARIEDQIRYQAAAIEDDLVAGPGECDVVTAVSQRMPMWTISEMVGVPPDDRVGVVHAADSMVSWNDPEIRAGREPLQVLLDSLLALHAAARSMAEARRAEPGDDLMTALVQAEVDGERLTDDEICAFFVLLSVAGNDTTRSTISHGMKALGDNARRPGHRRRRQGRAVLLLGQPGRRHLRRPGPLRRRPPPQRTRRLRRGRSSLLPGRLPRPPPAPGHLRRAPPPGPRPRARPPGAPGGQLHPRRHPHAVPLHPRLKPGRAKRSENGAMIIVSGAIYVDEADRDAYLQGCREIIMAARKADGCVDFHLSADPIEAGRINIYEEWDSVEAVEAFRGSGPSSNQMAAIRDARVFQHDVASTQKL